MFYRLRGLKKLNKHIDGRISDELLSATILKLNRNPENYTANYKNRMIHMIDSCSRGYITPMECWGAVRLGYVPENLIVRESAYSHLV